MKDTSSARGHTLGGVLLIAGCCIGAGMLGLPTLSGLAGFLPTSLMLVGAWLFMLVTGLLVLEANLWFHDEVSFVSIADRTIGPVGKGIAWGCFLFLFYILTMAYVMGAGQLTSEVGKAVFGVSVAPATLSIVFVVGLLPILYGGAALVDRCNRWCMLVLGASYIALVVIGLPEVAPQNLAHANWGAAVWPIPIMVISFGFHNMIPTLVTYCKRDLVSLRRIVVIGSAIPLAFYLLWNVVILGIIPVEQHELAFVGGEDFVGAMLRKATGQVQIGLMMDLFGLFAILTSFLATALSLVDFLADGLHVPKAGRGKVLLYTLTLLPPTVAALIYPGLFLSALGVAGAFGAVVLFGILPTAAIWKGRYIDRREGDVILPGGRPALIVIAVASLAIIVIQIVRFIV